MTGFGFRVYRKNKTKLQTIKNKRKPHKRQRTNILKRTQHLISLLSTINRLKCAKNSTFDNKDSISLTPRNNGMSLFLVFLPYFLVERFLSSGRYDDGDGDDDDGGDGDDNANDDDYAMKMTMMMIMMM